MTFALSGSTITQSGTDTDTSGLTGISGASIVLSGTGFSFCSLTSRLLIITGTLTIDPRKECLSTDLINAIQINAGGILNLGVQITSGSYTYESLGVGIILTGARTNDGSTTTGWYTPGVSGYNAAGLLVLGTLNWAGATIIARNNGFCFESGSTINIKNAVWIGSLADSLSAPAGRRIISSFQTSGAIVNGFRKQGGELILGALAATGSTFSGVIREDSVNAIFPNRLNNITLSNVDVGQKSNSPGLTIQSEGLSIFTRTTIVNSASGTDMNIYGGETETDGRNQGYVSIRRRVSVNIKKAGVAVQNAIVFIRDTNNGQRKNLNAIDDTADKTYRNLTDASGNTALFDLVCGLINVTGTNAQGASNAGVYTVDLRGNSNTLGNDTFTFHVLGYGIQYLSNPLPVAGVNNLTPALSVLPDLQISQSNPATASGYTTQATSRFEDVYDYAAYDKTLATGTELPTVSTRVFASADGTNGTSNYNFKIDSSATGISIDHTNSILKIKALTVTSSKYTDIALASGKGVTLSQSGTYSQVNFNLLATNLLIVAPGNTDLRGWTFAVGSTINASSGTAIVTVSDTTGITAGTGVTVQTASATISITTTIAASISLRNASNNSPIASGIANGSGNFSATYSGGSVSAILRVRKAGYVPYQSTVSITSAGLTTSAVLAVDSNYNPAY